MKAKLILGSGSPRRQDLLHRAGFEFDIITPGTEEHFDPRDPASIVAEQLAIMKSESMEKYSGSEDWVITADTVVECDGVILGKPSNEQEAKEMLNMLSGNSHTVCSGVCISGKKTRESFYDLTTVWFRELEADEIDHYIGTCKPFDKAGAYGIQEWIGMTGITGINGCYFNVMGLPVQRVYSRLLKLTGRAFMRD